MHYLNAIYCCLNRWDFLTVVFIVCCIFYHVQWRLNIYLLIFRFNDVKQGLPLHC